MQQKSNRGAQKMRHAAPSTSSLLGELLKVELNTARAHRAHTVDCVCCICRQDSKGKRSRLWTRLRGTTSVAVACTAGPQGKDKRAHHTVVMCQYHLLTSTHRCQC